MTPYLYKGYTPFKQMYNKYSIRTTVCVTGFDTFTQSSHNSFDKSNPTDRSVCFRAIVLQEQRLSQMIQEQALTDLLEFFEQRGFSEERALLMLAYLQGFGGEI